MGIWGGARADRGGWERRARSSGFVRGAAWRVLMGMCSLGVLVGVGASPALAAMSQTAYVANYASKTVTPIDTATRSAGTPIPIGTGPVAVAITPDGRTAYVTDYDANTVTPIDTANDTAGAPIPVGTGPGGIAITPDGTTAYVANFGSNNVTPIATATNTAGTPIRVGNGPGGIAITPDGTTAYVANFASNNVTPIATATDTADTPIAAGRGPIAVAITPDGKTAYVANFTSGNVTPIDTATGTAGTPVGVGGDPSRLAITPDGATAYVVNELSGSVTPINTATNTAGTPVGVGGSPVGIAITADGRTAYVANQGSADVTPIDTATKTAGTAISVGTDPNEVAITPDQGPVASFSAIPAAAGAASALNASSSASPDYPITTYAWRFGDGATATSSTPTVTHVYNQPGTYTATLTATDQAGCATALVYTGQTALCSGSSKAITTRTITVPAAKSPTTSSLPPTPVAPHAAPALSGLRVSPGHASLAGRKANGKCVKPTSRNAGRPRCTRSIELEISYRLSAPDAITGTLTLKIAGRDVNGRCVKTGNRNKRHPSCTRLVTMPGSISRTGKAGANTFMLAGKFAGRTLGAGTYVLTVIPAGGRAEQVSFTIVA